MSTAKGTTASLDRIAEVAIATAESAVRDRVILEAAVQDLQAEVTRLTQLLAVKEPEDGIVEVS